MKGRFWIRMMMMVIIGAKDAACTRSLYSIRSGSTNGINFPCPLESGPSSRFLGPASHWNLYISVYISGTSYLFSIGDPRHPSPLCPLCLMHDHTSSHLFECKSLPTSLSSLDLWTNPDKVEPFLATWGERLLAAT